MEVIVFSANQDFSINRHAEKQKESSVELFKNI